MEHKNKNWDVIGQPYYYGHTKPHLSHMVNILYTDWQGNILMNNTGRPIVLSLRPL